MGSPAMQIRGREEARKKKRLQPKLEPDDRAEAKSKVMARRKGGGYAPDRWTRAEGGGYGRDPVSQEAGPREEDTERLHQRHWQYRF
jgi:hypothetical protein